MGAEEVSEDVQRSLGRIEGTLDIIKEGVLKLSDRLQTHTADDSRRFEEHDVRIRKVERKQSYLAGAAAVVAALLTAGVDYLRH